MCSSEWDYAYDWLQRSIEKDDSDTEYDERRDEECLKESYTKN